MTDLYAMTGTLVHRGPDSDGFFQDSATRAFFGFRRLAIRELSLGNQPMASEDGQLVVVFNGEIYNYVELRTELEAKGHRFVQGHSDTEVLLHGYREWRAKLPERLNGMWAFVILDKKARRAFISRDRFGKKPFFFTVQNGTFAFASEIKALLRHRGLSFGVSVKGVQKYFGHGFFPYDQTLYREVRKLPAGCNLTVNLDSLEGREQRYWSYQIEPDESRSEQQWVDEIREKFSAAVSRRMVSDVPIGVFLSGGLDSSMVTYFIRQALGKDAPIHSCSIGFEDPSFDETAEARKVADLLGTRHSFTAFTAEILPSVMQGMFSLLDEPFSDSSMMSQYLLSQKAREKMVVALGGDAGDELFAGYDTFRALKMANRLEPLCPKPVHQAILHTLGRLPASHSYMPITFKLKRLLQGFGQPQSLWNPLWLGPLGERDIAEILQMPAPPEEVYSEAIELWDRSPARNPIDRALSFYGNLFLTDQILVKVDRMSMMHSLEVRTPFLDIDFVNCARRIPNSLKLKGYSQPKYILKKAMEGLLPDDVVWRKKVGFSSPLGRWFSDGRIAFHPGPKWPASARRLIEKKLREHRFERQDHRLFLWNTLVMNQVLESQNATMPGGA